MRSACAGVAHRDRAPLAGVVGGQDGPHQRLTRWGALPSLGTRVREQVGRYFVKA